MDKLQDLSSKDYRHTIYSEYVTKRKKISDKFCTEMEYQGAVLAIEHRLRGWFPAELKVPVLDMGCGAGEFLYLLEKIGFKDLTGVDLSLEQVKRAQQKCQKAVIKHGDVRDVLASNPGRYGLIVGFDIIEHFRKDEVLPLLRLIVKALIPGGRLILQTPNGESPFMGSVAFGDFTHEWIYTPSSLSDLLCISGLQEIEVRPTGPYIHGFKSCLRTILWKIVNILIKGLHIIETGNPGSGICTRVFIISAKSTD